MTGQTVAARLAQNGVELPKAQPAVANYMPTKVSGSQIFLSGQVCVWNGEFRYQGRLGAEFGIEDGQAAARLAGLNIVAQLQAALGDLDRIRQCVKLTVFVNCTPDFTDHPKVANGVSDFMVEVFGDAGRHVRSAVGATQLPFGVAVEVDAVFDFA